MLIFEKHHTVFGILNQIEIDEDLHHQVIGRIGCHSDSVTYIIPISYAYDGKNIFAHTLEGMKIGIMRKNSNVCFEVDSISNMDNWKSVICWGTFKELVNSGERQNALEQLNARNLPVSVSATAKLSSQYPFLPRDIDGIEGVVFRIQLHKRTGKFEKQTIIAI